MLALLVGKFQEDALAFRLLEAIAVAFEEAMRRALAANADEKRVAIAGALLRQLVRAGGEQAVDGAFEEQKRRLRLERRIGGDELTISRFELARDVRALRRRSARRRVRPRRSRAIFAARV